jgi:hypothetical protein
MELSDEMKQKYINQIKGWEGERRFDALLEKFTEDYVILNDLLLQSNQTTFQVDSLLMEGEALHFL